MLDNSFPSPCAGSTHKSSPCNTRPCITCFDAPTDEYGTISFRITENAQFGLPEYPFGLEYIYDVPGTATQLECAQACAIVPSCFKFLFRADEDLDNRCVHYDLDSVKRKSELTDAEKANITDYSPIGTAG